MNTTSVPQLSLFEIIIGCIGLLLTAFSAIIYPLIQSKTRKLNRLKLELEILSLLNNINKYRGKNEKNIEQLLNELYEEKVKEKINKSTRIIQVVILFLAGTFGYVGYNFLNDGRRSFGIPYIVYGVFLFTTLFFPRKIINKYISFFKKKINRPSI